jgi:F0F1-type ATP synthase assembly protein I
LAADDPGSGPSLPPERGSGNFARQLADVLDLPFVLVGTIIIGAGLGYFLDRWLGTSPALTLVFGGLGFAGGILQVVRRLTGKNTGKRNGK